MIDVFGKLSCYLKFTIDLQLENGKMTETKEGSALIRLCGCAG